MVRILFMKKGLIDMNQFDTGNGRPLPMPQELQRQQGQYPQTQPQQVQRPNPLAPPLRPGQQMPQQNPMPPYLQNMPVQQAQQQQQMPPQMGASEMLPGQIRQQVEQAGQGIGQDNLPLSDMQGRVQDNAGLPSTLRDRIKNKQLGVLAGLNR